MEMTGEAAARKRRTEEVLRWKRKNPEAHKAIEARYKASHRQQLRDREKQRRLADPEKYKERARIRRAAHPADPAYNKAWREKNAAHKKEMDAAYQRAHPEEVRERNARWSEANPDAACVRAGRMRAEKHNSPGRGVSREEWREVLDASLGLCIYCGKRKRLSMDHIESLTAGGAHEIENVAPACRSCNGSKGNRTLIVWLASRRVRLWR